MSDIHNLIHHAKEMMKHAYAPYSKFHVGCALMTDTGKIFSGCNVENASYRLTLCAEAVAITDMVKNGELKISDIAVISSSDQLCSPCGACRQTIREFATKDTKVHLVNAEEKYKTMLFSELLPESFGPEFLK